MGAYLDKPITEKENEYGGDGRTSFGVSSMQGWRKEMEDAHVCVPNVNDEQNTAIYGVFDGHCGAEVARFVGKTIVDVLKKDSMFLHAKTAKDVGLSLGRAFHKLDDMIRDYETNGSYIESMKNKKTKDPMAAETDVPTAAGETQREALSRSVANDLKVAKAKGGLSQQQAVQLMFKMMYLEKLGGTVPTKPVEKEEGAAEEEEEHEESSPSSTTTNEDASSTHGAIEAGCTSVVVAIRNDKIVTANAGDSRAVLSRAGKAVALSWDHKPQDERERARITKAGGFVSENGRVNGNLNLSRSIGDLKYKMDRSIPAAEQIITADPDIHVEDLTSEDEFIIIACDGIWDVLTRQEAVDEVHKRLRVMESTKGSSKTSSTAEGESSFETLADIAADILQNVCLAENTQGSMGKGCDNMTLMIVDLRANARKATSTGETSK